jgi:hypothetical protein
VQNDRSDCVARLVRRREERVQLRHRHRPAEPAEAADEDDRDLAVVDVPEPAKIPARRPAAAERTDLHARLRGAGDADLDTRLR